jgi:hypothetical protein
VVADTHHFDEEHDPDPNPNLSKRSDPDRIQVKSWIRTGMATVSSVTASKYNHLVPYPGTILRITIVVLLSYSTGKENYLISGAGKAEYNARSLASPVHHQVQVAVLQQ